MQTPRETGQKSTKKEKTIPRTKPWRYWSLPPGDCLLVFSRFLCVCWLSRGLGHVSFSRVHGNGVLVRVVLSFCFWYFASAGPMAGPSEEKKKTGHVDSVSGASVSRKVRAAAAAGCQEGEASRVTGGPGDWSRRPRRERAPFEGLPGVSVTPLKRGP